MNKPLIPVKPPKSVKLSYAVATLKPNSTEYSSYEVCKNLTEAKRLYRKTVSMEQTNTLVSLVLSIGRFYKEGLKDTDIVVAKTVGLNNGQS